MKTKIVLLVVLVLSLAGVVGYGRRELPSYEEQRKMQKQLHEQWQAEQNRRQSRFGERKRRGEGISSSRLVQLEARVAHLEYILVTQLEHPESASATLKGVLNTEATRQSRASKKAVQRLVRERIVKTVEHRIRGDLKK